MDDKSNIFEDDYEENKPLPKSATQILFKTRKLYMDLDTYDNIFDDDVKMQEYPRVKSREVIRKLSLILPVIAFAFVFILGIYIFVNNVNADIVNLIKIEENSKVGYINNDGKVIVKPKYLYGSDFYKGHAIVKNYNNLYGIIDGKGNTEVPFGNILSINLYSNRYVISKITKNGLKMCILDTNLKEVTRCIYDNISYSKSGIFMYTKDDTMGILNSDGKEIYSYKVDEVDDRNISIEISNSTSNEKYAKVKVNSSSTIINLSSGKEVYKYTLEDINVLDNNVFYIKNSDGNNKYFVVNEDKIIYETELYKKFRIEDIDSYIGIATKEDNTIDYINLLNKEKINTNDNIKYTYSNGVILEEVYETNLSKNTYTIFTPKKILSTFDNVVPVDYTFINDYMKVSTSNNKYTFISKDGNIISNEYDEVFDFDESGYSIVGNDNTYGVIDTYGKQILDIKYDGIKLFDPSILKIVGNELFIFKSNNKYGIVDSKNKIVIDSQYDDFELITTKYPIIKAFHNNEYVLINLNTFKELNIKVDNKTSIYQDYILSNNKYYDYNGNIIYEGGI